MKGQPENSVPTCRHTAFPMLVVSLLVPQAFPQVGIPHTNQEVELGKSFPHVCEEVDRRQRQGKIREGGVHGPAVTFQDLSSA